jgi:predicted nucleic acid-binding protein
MPDRASVSERRTCRTEDHSINSAEQATWISRLATSTTCPLLSFRRRLSHPRRFSLACAMRSADAGDVPRLVGDRAATPGAPRVLDAAGTLLPPGLLSLDAIHLASARLLGRDLRSIVTYDHRLVDAARQVGLSTVSPS